MTSKTLTSAAANAFAGFGFGAVLISCDGVFEKEPRLKGGSWLALLLAPSLALAVQALLAMLTRHGQVHRCSSMLTLAGSLTALLLLASLPADTQPAGPLAWLVFGLLTMRSVSMATSRNLRSDLAAGSEGAALPAVELGYYLGLMAGLWVGPRIQIASLGKLTVVLVADAGLQFAAGAMELAARGRPHTVWPTSHCPPRPFAWGRFVALAGAFVVLTMGIEAVFFGYTELRLPESMRGPIVAVSYSGPALAALFGIQVGLWLRWPAGTRWGTGKVLFTSPRSASLWRLTLAWPASAAVACFAAYLTLPGSVGSWTAVPLAVLGFFFYEVVYLALACRVGAEAKLAFREGPIAITLALMGAMAATATWLALQQLVPLWVLLFVGALLPWLALAFYPARVHEGGEIDNVLWLPDGSFAEPKVPEPKDVARALVQMRWLPPYASYLLPQEAAWWLDFASHEREERSDYEGNAWQELGIGRRLVAAVPTGGRLCVCGLAVGPGKGEIKVLRQALKHLGQDTGLDYLACDINAALAADHLYRIQQAFGAELRSGRMRCAVAVGRSEEVALLVKNARKGFGRRGLPFFDGGPALVLALGNVIGNSLVPDSEVSFFKGVAASFPQRPLSVLVGVSVLRAVEDEYTPTWGEFLLRTPRYLLEVGELKAGEPQEFSVQGGETLTLSAQHHTSEEGIQSERHLFVYQIRGELRTKRPEERLPAGSNILLFAVSKYIPASLQCGLRQHDFDVLYKPDYHQIVEQGSETREYAVLAVFTGLPPVIAEPAP